MLGLIFLKMQLKHFIQKFSWLRPSFEQQS